ncbi:hypothetical protein MH122_07630 [Bacillus pumilus]|uniref:hypothetical protein n=1 Tax=Bacillus TaxID=1386 RepID=UPI0022825B6A|nr:hypothetical protein [Bacillus pumilus]MCY7678670.1 hypothetical protein [Bacillus pumilus]
MLKAKNIGLFSLLLFAITMASLIVGNGSLAVANLCVSTGVAAILFVIKKQGKAKAAAF